MQVLVVTSLTLSSEILSSVHPERQKQKQVFINTLMFVLCKFIVSLGTNNQYKKCPLSDT